MMVDIWKKIYHQAVLKNYRLTLYTISVTITSSLMCKRNPCYNISIGTKFISNADNKCGLGCTISNSAHPKMETEYDTLFDITVRTWTY